MKETPGRNRQVNVETLAPQAAEMEVKEKSPASEETSVAANVAAPQPAAPAPKKEKAPKRQPSKNYHILVADDDEEVARYIKNELSPWYRFKTCPNGKEALKALLTGTYDLVVSDVMMPEMDGITLLKNIKANPQVSDVPVILLTSRTEVTDRLEGLKRGADAYLAKPFSMEELHVLIDNLMDNVRRLRGKFSGALVQADKVEHIEVKGNNDALMERIMRYVNENLSNPDYNVEQLTEDVGISRAQLHRKMKEITGVSTAEFIRNLRIEQAARLIREKKVNVTQVAYSVGFSNQAHFSTVFKRYFGMSPSEYAEVQRNAETS
jgi:YesN/AraC family two-component response regulator